MMNVMSEGDFSFKINQISSVIKKISSIKAKGISSWAIVLILANLYFLAQLLFGHNSIIAQQEMQKELMQKEKSFMEIKQKNNAEKMEINLIRSAVLDTDYLDELARDKLNYSEPHEKVITYRNPDEIFEK